MEADYLIKLKRQFFEKCEKKVYVYSLNYKCNAVKLHLKRSWRFYSKNKMSGVENDT